jgi:hypothetical protein
VPCINSSTWASILMGWDIVKNLLKGYTPLAAGSSI